MAELIDGGITIDAETDDYVEYIISKDTNDTYRFRTKEGSFIVSPRNAERLSLQSAIETLCAIDNQRDRSGETQTFKIVRLEVTLTDVEMLIE